MSSVTERLARVRERIEEAAKRAGRDPERIILVGISKKKPSATILEAVHAGLGNLGENYLQDAAAKIPFVNESLDAEGAPRPRWHFVGQLQTRKARDVVQLFDVVESVDREKLARELDRRAAAACRLLDVLLQVNVSQEAQKGGVAPDALEALLETCRSLSSLRVRGLMVIPAATSQPEMSREAFAALRTLAESMRATTGLELPEISMGMSADFEVAVEEGATWVRVGTALFGPREVSG